MDGTAIYQHYREYLGGYENCGAAPFKPRPYTDHPAPATIAVVVPWYGADGFMVSVESRARVTVDTHPCVAATVCVDTPQLLDAVAAMAHRLAVAPPDVLRVVVADDIDRGVAWHVALLLLSAVHHAGSHEARKAA